MSSRTLIAAAGLFGAAGTAGAAFAAHGGAQANLVAIAAAIAFVHAPALLALGLAPLGALRAPLLPGLLMILGTLLFSGDVALRAVTGDRLFANAAPIGGTILILAWLTLAILAVLPRRSA
ncbi:DUF423 domain-containing protein [Aureimonas phyllosphaerae]|uniref:Uncharacterized membrane protein YgdD (TMEM256/DUF423 family) n=1 Tax=Aureimonas phyllosphaerae TaxID=1166078 RepID=A0A7W6BXM8_9HYPH|nr:DUF423 domain-containing protein [Aureimonas phyllosphaerae]MBB3935591.1 uncharacterized membrane protein YgdD (TMEM256/DUF423 family) [Aureimonas phyllosphaerae]MBB3959599.1 uncharacterized membrane protein YgdD (TMEM256/DUF423 family) [Aureimonas phyllosphaerae]SFF12699.1 Uncharacterized membrane protein YgdD, TMEM256/DUF423 family [Aureimonas phyllosphaerae]